MSYKQSVTPNLDPVVYDGGQLLLGWREWCLAALRAAFNAPWTGLTAWIAWTEHTSFKHEDRNFPVGVYFPIWFSGYNGQGHAAFAYLNESGFLNIWTSPWEEDKPYFDNYSSIERLETGYHITFAGWSEDIGGMRVIEEEVEVIPAPVSPAQPIVTTVYTKLEHPVDLVTNEQPTNWWQLGFANYSDAIAAAQLDKGTPFRAYGKAQRVDLDNPVYYMTEEDFGQADITGVPVNNNGINTVDLLLAPTPTPPPVNSPDPTEIVTNTTGNLASASPPMSPIVPVTPPKPDWQTTTKNVADYEATQDYPVTDLETGVPAADLLKGQTVHAAVRFTKPDAEGHPIEYVMTQKSVDSGRFNGVPMAVLRIVKPIDIDLDDGSMLDDLDMSDIGYKLNDAAKLAERIVAPVLKNQTIREKIVKWVAQFVFRAKKQKI